MKAKKKSTPSPWLLAIMALTSMLLGQEERRDLKLEQSHCPKMTFRRNRRCDYTIIRDPAPAMPLVHTSDSLLSLTRKKRAERERATSSLPNACYTFVICISEH